MLSMALKMASFIDGALRENVIYGRPDRREIVPSSQPTLYKASMTSGVISEMPESTKVKSCSQSQEFAEVVIVSF